jgi:hypothetical protein
MKTIINFACLAFSCFIVGSPGQEKVPWKGETLREGDVTVVKNPISPAFKSGYLWLEKDLVLGQNKTGEEYILPGITSFAVDDQGRIYILVGRDSHIRVFDAAGKYLWTIGRKGQGPGEFMRPMNIQLLKDGTIFINDMQRLIYYTPEGTLIKETKSTMPMSFRLLADGRGDFIGIFPVPAENFRVVLAEYDSNQKPVRTLVSIQPSLSDMLLAGFLFDLTEDGRLIWGVSDKYELNVFDLDGKPLKKILKDYEPVTINDEEKKEMIAKYTGGSEVLPEGKTFPKYFTPIEEISVDESANIYVRTNERKADAAGHYFDVFDSSGRFLAKVALPAVRRLPVLWKQGNVYDVEEDKDGNRTICRYRITKGPW